MTESDRSDQRDIDRMRIQEERDALYEHREEARRGELFVRGLGYSYRGGDNLLARFLAFPRGEAWRAEGSDNVAGELLRAALMDSALLPRLREGDRTLDYSVGPGVALLLNDTRRACEYIDGVATIQARGRDKVGQVMVGYTEADTYFKQVADLRQVTKERLDNDGINGNSTLSPQERSELAGRLVGIEIAMTDAGVNSAMRNEVLGGLYRNLMLAGEDGRTVRDSANAIDVKGRVRSKRQTVLRVEEAVRGVSTLAHLLNDYLGVKADLGGLIKVELGPEAQVATHVMNVMGLSDHLNTATTIAMREMMRLVYRGGSESRLPGLMREERDAGGNVVREKHSLTTTNYTLTERQKFFRDWEECVEAELVKRGINEDTFQLAEDAVTLTTVFTELYTMGGMAFKRDRRTGKRMDPSDVNGGSGSLYPTGDVDTAKKTHQLHVRKSEEAKKGRKAPRPGVIKGLAQELQFSIFQYTEASYLGADGRPVLMGKSVLEALTEEPVEGQREYTIRDMLWSLKDGAFQGAMYFAFRAAQIHEKLDELPSGKINVIQELGGGPEKLVQDEVEALLGLHKAMQVIPFATEDIPAWENSDRSKVAKRIEIQRNMVNILSDFVRAATSANASTGGFNENPNWRGFMDWLPVRMYERLVTNQNIMTPQQFWLAWRMGRDNEAGGVLTEEVLSDGGRVSDILKKILAQNPEDSIESLINTVQEFGFAGSGETLNERLKAFGTLISESAVDTKKKGVFANINKDQVGRAATRRGRTLRDQIDS